MKTGGTPSEGPKLPKAPESWDGNAAKRRAIEEHVLSDRHATEEQAFNAALGGVILSYLDSLPVKARLEVLLALKGQAGFPERRMIEAAGEDGREVLLTAAGELAAEGKLRRLRRRDGPIFWRPAGPLLAEHAARDRPPPAGGPREPPRPAVAPEGAHDGGPQTGGPEM